MTLKYLFQADFTDGTTYHQGADDLSLTDPTRSAYYDIAQRLAEVIRFRLVDDNHTYSVDLRDGQFAVDGVLFSVHDQFFVPHGLRLIYFRESRSELIMGATGATQPGQSYVNRYFFGWQATDKTGKNHQHMLAIA